jgi:hypothetical protein
MRPILISKLTLIITLILSNLLSNPPQANAEITTNDNWTMQIDDIFINPNSPSKNQKKQIPQKSPQDTDTGTNYKGSLSFSISNNLIDYGFISPTNSIYRTSNLTISSNAIKKFIVVGYENHPLLTTDTNNQIPDSTCDNGSCSETTPSLWSNTLTYGFGFRCENITEINCPADMKEDNYYKQFSNEAKNESPDIIMSGKPDQTKNNQIQLTYKINTSKTQPPGYYSNSITYIAAPGY